ncbi:hypothetical protein UFOVP211_6 [uncultured Caudovirales phage]|uniref:Uncharacterized protein n=1 Tax=uncultured Caudovirales phage TaxID=2100421 RepID=A0A6J7WNE5_9CAUD|nr:hypothetical protein UFOVP211_6 [uncultured Caudovirales phage]
MNKATKVLNEVKTLLGLEIKLAQMKLQDGVTVLEAESFEAGYSVGKVTPEGIVPARVGEHILEDGRVLVIEQEGVIKEIKDAQTEQPAPEMEVEVEASEEVSQPTAKKIIETISKESFFSEIEALKKENLELKEQLLKLSEVKEETTEAVVENNEPAAEPIAFNPENKQPVNFVKYGNKRPKGIMDSVLSKIAN